MHQRIYRIEKKHAGAGETHDFTDAFLVEGFVAMDGAIAAGGFIIAEGAAFEALVGVGFEGLAVGT